MNANRNPPKLPQAENQADPASLRAFSLDSAHAQTAAALPAARRHVEEDAPNRESELPARRIPMRSRMIVGVAAAGCFAILALAAVQTARTELGAASPANDRRAALMAPTGAAPPAAANAPASLPALPSPARAAVPPPAPIAAPAPAEPSTTTPPVTDHAKPAAHATIRLLHAGPPLTVDGKRANAASVVVACGPHTVAVGTEKARHVDAPCGRTLLVSAGKSSLAPDATKGGGQARLAAKKH